MEHQPARLHLVLLSREDPPLPLARLRAAGALGEIRQEQLRFTDEEAAAFLRQVMGLDLVPGDARALRARTEGWIAGLQLAGLALQGRAEDPSRFIRDFSGSHHFILDYLADEVFTRQPPDVQGFLLKTAILDRLSPTLCDAVTGRSDGYERLRALEAGNLFLQPLDAGMRGAVGHWYRYHHLFADLLRHRLQLSDLDIAGLHAAAGRWYAAHGHRRAAVRHLLAAEDWLAAVPVLAPLSEEMMRRGETSTLLAWLQRLPEAVYAASPFLRLQLAWSLILSGRLADAEGHLTRLEEASAADPTLLTQILTAQVHIARARNDLVRTVELSERTLALLPADEVNARGVAALNLGIAYWTGGRLAAAIEALTDASRCTEAARNTYAQLMALSFLALIDGAQGRLRAAAARCRHVIRLGGDHPATGLAHQMLANLAYEADDLDAIQPHLDRALTFARAMGNAEMESGALRLQALCQRQAGDVTGAQATLGRAQALLQEADVPPQARKRLANASAQMALDLGDLAAARSWARQVDEPAEPSSFYRWLQLLPARLALAAGDRQEAAALLASEHERAAAQAPPWRHGQLEIRLLQAVAAPETQAGLAHLGEALNLAGAEPFRRSFLDKGEPLLALLRLTLARGGPRADRAAALLAPAGSRPPPIDSPLEPLSARELETVALLAQGLTYAEIARELTVSVNTVKTHLQNVYTKIDVNDRRAAVARARAMGLI